MRRGSRWVRMGASGAPEERTIGEINVIAELYALRPRKCRPSMKRNGLLLFAVYVLSAVIVFPLAAYCETTTCGVLSLEIPYLLYGIPLSVGTLAAPLVALGLISKGTRIRAAVFLSTWLLLATCTLIGGRLSTEIRMAGIRAFVDRTPSLIAAINQYVKEQSVPPATLSDLVPAYLPTLPCTGMSAYPTYRFMSGDQCRKEYGGNPWAIIVDTPSAFLNWDQIFYLPDQNYPEYGYGGGIERIGEWAYVHE